MIGFVELLKSKKATMCLIVLAASVVVALSGHMDAAFAAIIGSITTIFLATHTATDIASINSSQSGKAPPPTNIPE
jgi:hydrogenase-4 membrane subunit HyfE